MDTERFRDRVAIVVGAAQGIGLVAAEQLVREGASVVMSDVNPAVAEEAERLNQRADGSGAPARYPSGMSGRSATGSLIACARARQTEIP